jgi:hypothetical protein
MTETIFPTHLETQKELLVTLENAVSIKGVILDKDVTIRYVIRTERANV